MTLRQFFGVVEMRTKTVSLSGLLIGTLAALRFGREFSWRSCLLMWAASLAVDMGTTAFNSFFDFARGADRRETNVERDKVLVHEGVAPESALLVAGVCYAFALMLGFALAVTVGWEVAAIGAACLFAGFLYNGGPVPISGTPFGELLAGGFLGFLLPILAAFAMTGAWDARVMKLSIPSFLFVASILTVNNTCDRAADARVGRKTLSILVGYGASRVLIPALGAAAYAFAFASLFAGLLSPLASVPLLLGIFASLAVYLKMDARSFCAATKSANMRSIVLAYSIYAAAMAIAIFI